MDVASFGTKSTHVLICLARVCCAPALAQTFVRLVVILSHTRS